MICADSEDPKSIADYNKYGLKCYGVTKGPGSVNRRMVWMQSLKKIVIDPKRCPDTYNEFVSYQYMRTKDGDIMSGYPDADNHHIDAVSYSCQDIWQKPGNKAPRTYTGMLY